MGETNRGYSPRRAGEVVGVNVYADEPRPVWITVNDHAHTYEIAWHNTDDGPVITDLRVRSDQGTPITTATLKRINTDTLLRAAQRYDTAEHAQAGQRLRAGFDSALDDSGIDTSGIEAMRFTEGVIDAMVRHAPPGAKVKVPQRRGGRPEKITPQFLAQVAEWAREGRDRNAAVYPYVAERASAEMGYVAADDTVKGWIRRCKDAKPPLLGRDELRKPRTPTGEDS